MPAPLQLSRFAQFHLGTLLWSVAGLGIFFALLRNAGPGGMLGLGMLALLIIGHVAGNVLGTQLRDQNSAEALSEPARQAPASTSKNPAVAQSSLPTARQRLPVARLSERSPLGRLIFVVVGLSAALGGAVGGLMLGRLAHVSLSGWAVGTCSAALVAGFVGFMMASFLEMSCRAWWQATHAGSASERDT